LLCALDHPLQTSRTKYIKHKSGWSIFCKKCSKYQNKDVVHIHHLSIRLVTILAFPSHSTWHLVGSWLFWIRYLHCLVISGASLEVVWRFQQRTFYIGSLSCQEVLNWV
jgi:hypothetical protein